MLNYRIHTLAPAIGRRGLATTTVARNSGEIVSRWVTTADVAVDDDVPAGYTMATVQFVAKNMSENVSNNKQKKRLIHSYPLSH